MLSTQSSKVLIVDDEPKNIQVLANTLSREGYQIEYATNGDDAIDWVKNGHFDLILLDIMMPEIDGFQTCEQIKNNEESGDIPIIFLTAKTDKESIVKGFKSGGTDYITKPFNEEELLARVNTHIKLQKSKNAIDNLYKDTMESIRYAKNIQKSIVPPRSYLNKLIPNNLLIYKQRDVVGGDFYWVKDFKEKIFLIVGDCTGHGVPGAMMSMLGISVLNNVLIELKECKASTCLSLVYDQLQSYVSPDAISYNDSIDLGLLIIDKKAKHIQYSANNFQMIIASETPKINSNLIGTDMFKYSQEINQGMSFEYLKSLSGVTDKNDEEFNIEFDLSTNEKVYLFSDGITDQFGGTKNKKLTRRGILDIIQKYNSLPVTKQGQKIENEFNNWKKDNQQVDDIILFGFTL